MLGRRWWWWWWCCWRTNDGLIDQLKEEYLYVNGKKIKNFDKWNFYFANDRHRHSILLVDSSGIEMLTCDSSQQNVMWIATRNARSWRPTSAASIRSWLLRPCLRCDEVVSQLLWSLFWRICRTVEAPGGCGQILLYWWTFVWFLHTLRMQNKNHTRSLSRWRHSRRPSKGFINKTAPRGQGVARKKTWNMTVHIVGRQDLSSQSDRLINFDLSKLRPLIGIHWRARISCLTEPAIATLHFLLLQ